MLSTKTLIWLSKNQQKLDDYIIKKHNLLIDNKILKNKIIAFMVELGEYANEEKSFKYWSTKPSSELEIQLDEYIDGIHFLISIGNQIGINFTNMSVKKLSIMSLTETYLKLLQVLSRFNKKPTRSNFTKVLNIYLHISEIKKYSEKQIIDAYEKKNKINFSRQDNNY